jgi:hypothetical protein
MNKEKIEKAIKILLKEDRFYDDETEIKATKVLLKYINDLEQSNKILDTECSRLEQKESILDKVTEACRKQMTENEETILEIFPGRLLNIIEGDDNK